MNELEKLYNALFGAGKTTKTFDEFKAQYAQDAEYRNKVYEVTFRDGLTKKDRETFFSTYSAQAPATPPTPAAQPAAQVPVGEDLKKKGSTTELPSAQSSLALSQEPKEEDYFTGTFGNILRGFDQYVPLGIGDFVDDMARAVAAGYRQGDVGQAANKLILSGTTPTTEEIQNLINKRKAAQQLTPSKEFQDYQKTYEEEGKGFWGVVKGIAKNPSILPEIMLSSLTTMATNTDALIAGLGAIGTGAGIGAATGATAGATAGSVVPVAGTAVGGAGGALAGAASGSIAAVPYAFGLASSVVEMGSTFAELLEEELGQKEMTKENVKSILENPDKLNDIRNKAIARGVLIGTIDAFTGKLASGVGAKVISKSAAKSATGAATKGAVTRSVGTGAAIEAAGGSIGEATARAAIGQEMDISEIALEGLAELPGGVRSTIQARFAKPSYRVNGEQVSAQEVDNLIETMTPQQLANTKIDIKNDYQGRQVKIQDKIVTDAIKTQVKEANPELNDASLDAITQLEKELKKLDGNTTQTGKDKAAAIRSQIKNIQENQIQEEAAVDVIEAESPEATQKRTARIAELESVLVQPENEKGTVTIGEQLFERAELENELETLKAEEDAVQKQAAGEVPVQSETRVGEEVAEGVAQAEPQVVTQEGQVQEVVSLKTPQEVESALVALPREKKMTYIDGNMPIMGNENIIAEQYIQAKQDDSNPQLVENVEKLINESLPTQRLQPELGTVQPTPQAATQPTGLAVPTQPSPKREEVKSSIQRIANAGLLRSAETGKSGITEQEIDAQMALTDAMSRVWQETTGKDDFYETFFEDVKEGDVEAIKEKGGALFQDVELPQRPISRVSLGVFELPEFQKMRGNMVAPQSVSDLMKSRGKQIEKDIVNTVLGYEKYKGQKRISFDEFRDDVETQLMKLERIDTRTYASYGMDNLGDDQNYGTAQTIIFNSPIDHGQFGHFRSDFTKGNLAPKTWEIRQIPNTEQYVAIDADMPPGVGQNEIAQYVGTAGPKADVERWIADRNSITDKEINKGLFGHIRNWFNQNTGVYTLAELQSDYFQKNKANDLYASRIPQEEVDEYVNKNFRAKLDREVVELIKDEFGIETSIERKEDGSVRAEARRKSDNSLVGSSTATRQRLGYTIEEEAVNEAVVEGSRVLANINEYIAKRRREIIDDYNARRSALKAEENKYITKRIEEIKKSEEGNLMLKQFVASQKVHELRLFRESLKHAADKGATELWFPTPFTIAVIEGYVSSTGNAPYEVVRGDESQLEPGDMIDYGGTEMIVVESSGFSITVAPRDEVSIYDLDDLRDGEITNRMDELEYDLKRQVNDINAITREEAEEYNTDEFLSEQIQTSLTEWFENNPEEETVRWSEIEDEVRDYVSDYYNDMSVEDLVSWAGEVYMEGDTVYAIESRRNTERLGQPSEYESDVNEDDFEGDLSEEQYTVVKKYEELGEMMKKMRPDTEVVTDNNGKRWLKTAITEADASNPIIAFQEEGGKVKGAIDFSNDNKASVYVFDGADISTLAHEMSGHLGRRVLERLAAVDEQFAKDYEAAKKWAGVQDNQWTRVAEEKWARAFEKYLREGKAPSKALTNVFQKLRDWLTNIYKTIKGSSIDIELTPEIVAVFDNLLATKGEQLMTADTKDATVLEKVLDFLDKAEADLDKFGRETAGMNLAIPVVKAIIKSVKALVKTGITLQEAIKRAAAQNNVSEQDVIDSIEFLTRQREQQAKPEGVSEMELPGYNRMIGELEGVIEKSYDRGADDAKAMQNAIDYLQGSKVYENASDTQREKMVRDVRKMFGKREKAAPKPEKLFGETKDVKQITMSEYDLLKKQLADTARGAKNAISLWRKTSNALATYLKKMVDGGHITMKQSASVLKRFSGVNMFDERSINRFVDYMQKVFENAAYAEQIEKVRGMLPTAKKNVQTKLGVSQSLVPLLNQLFAINPTLIPDAVFDKYVGLVEMMGQRKAVLELAESGKVVDVTEEILDAIDEEVSRSEELAELFQAYPDKLIDEDGNIDFSGTITKMLKDDIITEDDAKLMRKYKKNIVPMVEREAKSDEEIAAEKEVLIEAVRDASIDSDGLPMKDERNDARELAKLIKTNGVEELDNTQLKNLLRVIDNINNGYLPHFAELMIERINAKNEGKVLEQSAKEAKPLKLSTVYSNLKRLLTGKDKFTELIRRNPLFYIDQVFGNFKTRDIYNSVFEKAAEGQAMFKRAVTELNNKLDAAEEAVAKSFKFDSNKLTMSKFKMMTFMVQLEYLSNPENNKVNSASKYLKKTIEHIKNGKSSFGERDADMLQDILNKYTDDNGEIDNDKLYNSFNSAEKKAIKTIQEINESTRDKAIYTASVIRGDRIHPLNNYVHLNVLHEFRPEESLSGASFVDSYNNSLRPSTKAKSLISRTGKVSPLNFDVFASANRGAKFVLMDYYLTKPIRTARKTINEASAMLKKDSKDNKQQRDILNAIDRVFEEAVENLLTSNFTSSSFGDKVVEYMSKQGYRAVLASLPRFAAELSSNVAFAMIAAPKDFKAGVSQRGVVLSADAPSIMANVGSKQVNRMFPHDTLSGRLVDTSILSQASGVKGSRAKNDVANKIQQIYNLSLKKYKNVVETMADALIATPDKMVMRPMWFGSFANEFKRISGKEVNFDKIAANDELYMAKNKEAIDSARNVADQKTVLTGASDNAFMGVLKGTPKPNQKPLLRAFNMFNNFMTNFLIYEYMTARTGIMAAMGNGSISRKEGVALLGAVATRMTLYTLLTNILSSGLVGLFVDNEDEDDEKSFLQKVGQAMASSVTSMLLGRDFGNATKAVVNQGVEYANEKFLDFLREGDYDPYKDAIQYTVLPPERKGKQAAFSDMIMNMMGPFGPSVKTAEFAFRKATEPEKKEAAARERVEKEQQIRLPLEVLGNIGMIPLYKDVRKIVNAELYKGLDNAEKKQPMNKIGKEDMKKYFPQMYNELYGPGGSLYDVELIKKEMRKEKERMKKEMKNEMYNYTPK